MTLQFASSPDLFDELQREMDRVFGGLFRNRIGSPHESGYPSVNLWEDDESFHVEAELPGVPRSELEIEVVGDELTIRGERKSAREDGYQVVHSERQGGKFARKLALATEVDVDAVAATLADGVLRIRLPKARASLPRKIEVR